MFLPLPEHKHNEVFWWVCTETTIAIIRRGVRSVPRSPIWSPGPYVINFSDYDHEDQTHMVGMLTNVDKIPDYESLLAKAKELVKIVENNSW